MHLWICTLTGTELGGKDRAEINSYEMEACLGFLFKCVNHLVPLQEGLGGCRSILGESSCSYHSVSIRL